MAIKKFLSSWRITFAVLSAALIASVPAVFLTAPARAKTPSSTISWAACPFTASDLECGTLSVPLNYAQPAGEKITIAVSRLKTKKPSLKRGVMLLNPGGPGGAGLDMPLDMATLMPKSVVDRYDLIGFDPRGVGRSAPVSCGLTLLESAQVAPPLEQQASFDPTVSFMHHAADGCATVSGPRLPYMTTANTARDMDRIRQALGESRISYFGYSYGTYLGAVYASLFSSKTDRFVLDSATQPRGDWREQFRNWKLTDQTRFPDFGNFLIAHADEYGLGTTQAEVRQTYFQLVQQLNNEPVPLGSGVMVDGAWFREITFGGLYSDSYFAETADFWKLIKDLGSAAAIRARIQSLNPRLLEDFPTVPDDNGGSATLAVLCDDVAWSHSVEQYRQELNADNALFPMFAKLGSHIWPCAFWPNGPVEPPVTVSPVGASNHILIVQNLRDPATPIAGAIEMRLRLGARAKMVTVVAGGHGASYGANNFCAQDKVTNYLASGGFPASDELCPAENNPQTFSTTSSENQKAMKTLHSRMW